MKIRQCTLVLAMLTIGSLLDPAMLEAQQTADAPNSEPVFVSAGLAVGTLGPGIRLGMNGSRNRHFGVRFTWLSELNIFGPSPAETVWDVGILWRGREDGNHHFVAAAAGVALAGGMRRGEFLHRESGWFAPNYYEEDPFYTIGLPLEAEAVWTPWDVFGVGLGVFANLNPTRSVAAATLSIHLGRIR